MTKQYQHEQHKKQQQIATIATSTSETNTSYTFCVSAATFAIRQLTKDKKNPFAISQNGTVYYEHR